MQIIGSDPELVEIYNIRNLESIKVWDLVTNTSSKMMIIPAILISYDGNKGLNLCSKDKYYDVYVKKVMEVYHDEKNNILEDALTDPFRLRSHIDIDERSKKILESGELIKKDEVIDFYKDKDAYNQSLCFERDKVIPLIPILKYSLERLFSYTDKVVSLESEISGYRENYILEGKVDGVDTIFPFTFSSINDNEFLFHISGFFELNEPIEGRISFNQNGITVILSSLNNRLIATLKISITNGAVKSIFDLERDGLTISYKNEDLPNIKLDNTNIANLDYDTNLSWFKLPWGSFYGIDTSTQDLSDTEKTIGIDSMYIQVLDNAFFKKEFYSKTYKRNKTVSVDAEDMVLNCIDKSTTGFMVDSENKLFVIETSFGGASSDYRVSGKNFYHVVYSEEGILGIKRDGLIPLSRSKDVIKKCDIVDKVKLKTLVSGE